ncbi:MAG: NHLP bacteriocin export ABC transporter permease/ATPase subunit [Flavobacteriales bacterium]|nr:NHLP bacteriocin export ABC transporter permease/ATPase subunit [Flavobacteriales bacterium]
MDINPLILEFRRRGTERVQSVIDPFLADDPDKVYFILDGSVNLSTTKVVSGEAYGRLDNFTTLEKGELVIGGDISSENNLCFLVDAEVESVFIDLTLTDLKELSKDAEFKDEVIALIEKWVNRLYEGVADDTSVQTPVIHDFLGFDRCYFYMGNSVVGNRAFMWVKVYDAEKCKFNRHLEIDFEHIFFPLGVRSYLTLEGNAKIEAFKSEDIIEREGFWSGLRELSTQIFKSDAYEIKNRVSAETNRLIKKYTLEKEDFANSLKSFSQVFQKDTNLKVDFDTTDHVFNALSMVLQYEKMSIVFPKGYSENEDWLSEICRYNGLRYREVLLEPSWYTTNNEDAFLAYLNNEENEPIAIIPHKGSLSFINPRTKEIQKVNAENASMFKQEAFVFYRPFDADKTVTLKDILLFTIDKNKIDLLRVFGMGLAGGVLMLFFPILTAQIFDFVIPSADKQQLLNIAFALLAISFGTVGFDLVKQYALMRAQNRLDYKAQSALWDRLLNLPSDFFTKYTTGDLASRSMGINQMKSIVSGAVIASVLALAFSVLNLGLLLYYNVNLAMLAIAFSLLQITIIGLFARSQLKLQKVLMEQNGKLSGIAFQILNGIARFRASGAESRAFLYWFKSFMSSKSVSIDLAKLQNAQTILNSLLGLLSTVFIFIIVKTTSNNLTTGQFFAFLAAYGAFVGAIVGMSGALIQMLQLPVIYDRLRPILETKPECETQKEAPTKFTGAIEINNINFRYKEDAPLTIKNLSLSIKSGEYVALVGPSGSGKSTLIRLLLGFSKPESGSLYYDKQDMDHYDPKMIRRNMGVVLQDGDLMSGDIYTNIVGSSAYLTLKDAWAAARAAAFDKDVRSFPMGMHTIVNEEGGTLSGGQKQRLMIARALVHKPKILIFDEATSALDNETQAIVTASLDNLNVTRIVIAHRLSTIINADTIHYLEAGELIESGSYEELMALKGKFFKLAERQIE